MGNGGSHEFDDDDYVDAPSRKRRRRASDDKNFPTPASLVKAQREFAKEDYQPECDENGIPAPFPPPTNKEEFFDPKQYEHIDKHARNCPLSKAEDGYEDLVEYLIEPADDELGKLRACYVWLGSQNISKINKHLGDRIPASESPLFAIIGMVETKKYGWCWDIFTKMCRQAGIPCQKVDCKIKGSSYRTGKRVPAVNGYSCLVYVDGTCRVIDPVWGCTVGIAKKKEDKEWTLISEGGNAEDKEDNDFFEIDEYWFCTDAEQLVYTHLNVEPITQLLASPVTESQFDRMAYLTKGFFELGMTDTSHPKCVVDCGDGEAVMDFSMKDSKKLGFGYVLYKSLRDEALNEFDGKKLKQFVFMHMIKGKLQVRVDLPWIGKYKLRLIGKNFDTGKAHKLCEYILFCTTPKFNAKANPENERDEWGPGAEAARLGLEAEGIDGGIVVLEKGEGEIKFKVKYPDKIKIIHQLESEDYEPGELRDYVRQYKTESEVIFVAKVPEHGNYNFKLHAKGENEEEYKNICTYLVTADVGAADITPFPPAPDPVINKIGDVAPVPCDVKLVPISHPKPVIKATESGEFDILMKQEGDLTITVKQTLEHHSALADDVTNYVMQKKDGDQLTFSCVMPKAGTYSLTMTAMVNDNDVTLYQYVINANYPKPGALPFPVALDHGIDGVELIEPRSGVLLEETDTRFKVKVPGAEKVWVEETQLRGKRDTWSGEANTGEAGKFIYISTITEEHKDGVQLYKFKVITKSEMDELEAENQQALLEAERRRKEMELRAEEEARAAKERADEEREQNKLLADQFEENREYFEDEERRLQQRIDDEGEDGGGEGSVVPLVLTSMDNDMKNKELMGDIETARKDRQDGEDSVDGDSDGSYYQTYSEYESDGQGGKRRVVKRRKVKGKGRKKRGEGEDSDSEYESDGNGGRRKKKGKGDKGKGGAAGKGKGGKGGKGGRDGGKGGRGKKEKEKDPRILAIEEERKRKREAKARALAEERARKKRERQARIERAMTMMTEGVEEKDLEKLGLGLKEAQHLRIRGPAVETARRIFVQETERKNINTAMENKDLDGIYMALETIATKGLTKPLHKEINRANKMAVGLQKLHKLRRMILDMDRWTIAEIRSYSRPPPVVQTVLQAALLLLGEDEKTTSEWVNIQALLNTIGPMGLYARVLRFDTDNLHPEITARALEAINTTSLKGVRSEGSIGAATFFQWTMGALEQAASARPPDEGPFRPAGWKRQRELLGKQNWMHGGKRYMVDPFSSKVLHGYSNTGTPRVTWSDVQTTRSDRSNWGATVLGVPNNNPKPGITPRSNIVSKIMERKLEEKEEVEKKHGRKYPRKQRKAASRPKTHKPQREQTRPSLQREPTKHPATKEKKREPRKKKKRPKGKEDERNYMERNEHMKLTAQILGEHLPRRKISPKKPFSERTILPPIQAKQQQQPPPKSNASSQKDLPADPIVDTRWRTGHPAWRNHWTEEKENEKEKEKEKPKKHHHHDDEPERRTKGVDDRNQAAKMAYRKFNWGALPTRNFKDSHLKHKKQRDKKSTKYHKHDAELPDMMPPINEREKVFRQTYTETGLRNQHNKRFEQSIGKNSTATKSSDQKPTKHVVLRPSNPGSRASSQGNSRPKKVRSAPSDSPRLRRSMGMPPAQPRPQSAHPRPTNKNAGTKKS